MRRVLRSNGHTLLEVMIAVALGLIVTAGAVSLYRSQRLALTRATDAAQMHDAGMTALTLIALQLQMAGFTPADAAPAGASASVSALFGCSAARPVGTDDRLTCEALAGHSDGIAIRYVADNVSTWPSAAAQPTDCLGQGLVRTLPADAQGVPVVNRFYAKASGSTGEPELYCEGSGKAGSSQPLVEGVERLRLRYWPAAAPAALDASALTPDQWNSVVAVDVCVLVRGARDTAPSRYVDCDGVPAVGTDKRARDAFWRRIAIRNNSGGET
ncbi:PilW family protein [Paraburkholderia rhizosphaerae]|uniref:Type IV pilus assembly protein PilW n=1 Tax=Paraburkholderia rhizosphaerae TaxID=480658 RepID=A0A4R8LBS9_9BURK|nr:PilW family protein [Paraburkholderia rhizosphaerae]TDY40373.1 type IV pilus assembly protein PilW [Paraburkholderia rhizosphaerae]